VVFLGATAALCLEGVPWEQAHRLAAVASLSLAVFWQQAYASEERGLNDRLYNRTYVHVHVRQQAGKLSF
jgi:hypothetical protein